MSGSTDRVLTVLEFLAKDPERPKVLSEVSGAISIPPATCARILCAMAARGYAEKNGRRSGYRLGPMVHALSNEGPYMKDIYAAASREVQKCAETLGEHVVLSARRGDKIYKIVEFEGNPEIRITSRILEGLYNTATGRLLFAFAGEKEIESYINLYGLPDNEWAEGCSREELKRKLREIRESGFAGKKTDTLAACAFPVRYGGEYLGLGCSMISSRFTGDNKKRVMNCLRETAKTIEKKLERRQT